MTNFSYTIFFITIGTVLVEMLAAWQEKVFSCTQNKKLRIPLLYHWGIMGGDLILLPIFNGVVAAYLTLPIYFYVLAFTAAFSLTWVMHKIWWPTAVKEFFFMFPHWNRSKKNPKHWFRDLSISGWIHFAYMTAELVIIAGYIFAQVPREIVLESSTIFSVFIPIAVVQPKIMEKCSAMKIATDVAILYLILALITFFKIG